MAASDVATATCMRYSSGTPAKRSEYSSTGTVTMPPPTPSMPATNPATTPDTARMASSGSSSAKSTRADSARLGGQFAVSVNGRPARPASAACTSPTMDSAMDSGVRPPMSSPTGARSRGRSARGVGAEVASSFSRRAGRA